MRRKIMVIAPIVSLFICLFAYGNIATADTRETWISDNAYDYCEEIGNAYNICPEILMAVIETESSGQATARNGNCIGLMQVSSKYHSSRMQKLGVSDLNWKNCTANERSMKMYIDPFWCGVIATLASELVAFIAYCIYVIVSENKKK